jgi:hypothetical protein
VQDKRAVRLQIYSTSSLPRREVPQRRNVLRQLYDMRVLLLQCFATAIAALAVRQPYALTQSSVMADLNKVVSPASQVKIELRLRWSTYNAPTPAVVVNVTSEKDVASVVRAYLQEQENNSTC